MFREGLHEGATLKVREYLAAGIPVYSGHKDTALPESFAFYFHESKINLKNMINFGLKMQKTKREDIRNQALPYVEKENIIKFFINQMYEVLSENKC
jgi:hypothetical protein